MIDSVLSENNFPEFQASNNNFSPTNKENKH